MIRPLLHMGDPRLLRVAQPVTEFDTPALDALVADMRDTMREAGGIGLAAPQIGVDLRLVIFGRDTEDTDTPPSVPFTVLANPHIEPLAEEQEEGWEGCLSVPGLRGLVPRYLRIRYSGLDAAGRPLSRDVGGLHARVVQHECDHLDGMLYPRRIRDLRQFGYLDALPPVEPR